MALVVQYAFATDFSDPQGANTLTSTANAAIVSDGLGGFGLGKTGATMPVLPGTVLAASQSDDRTLMFDAKGALTTWWVRWERDAINSGTWGCPLLAGAMNFFARNAADTQMASRPTATQPSAVAWTNYAVRYIRATGIATFFRNGASVGTASFAAGTQLSVGADRINIAEWSTTGAALKNLRIWSDGQSDAAVAATAGTAVTGAIAGALTIGTTAQVAVGAFADRPRALTIAATAQVTTSPVRTTPGALPIGTTAQVSMGAFADRAGALSIAATARLDLVPVPDRTAALGATSTAAVTLDATSDRPAALAIGATSQVSLAPAADRAAAFDVAAVAQLGLVPVQERAGALTISSQAGLQLLAGGQTPGALILGVVAQLVAAPVRQTPGALDVAAVATVMLSSVLVRPAALAMVARAQLEVVPARELERALAITVRVMLGLQQDVEDEGSLLLYVGAPEYRPWVRTGPGGERVWVGPTHAESIAWLITGRYRDR